MRKFLPQLIVIGVIAVLAVSIVSLRRYSPYRVSGKLMGNPEVVLSLSDVETVGRIRGKKIWSFKAKHADVARGKYRTEFTSVHDGKIYDDGSVVASISAGKALYDSISGDVDVSGGIYVQAPRQGLKFNAQTARWYQYFKQLTCPGKISLRAGDSKLTGKNLVLNTKEQYVTMDDPEVVIAVEDLDKLDTGNTPGEGKAQ